MTSFDKIFADSQFKSFIFKARVKMENYNVSPPLPLLSREWCFILIIFVG